jgi:PAS domain-containing protein
MASVSDGETVDIQFRLTTDDGGEQWVQARGEPIFDSAGKVVRVAGFVVGITDRRERQRELERYKTTIEASGDPVYTLDADGAFTVVNEAFCAMTGYEEADLLGAHFATILAQTNRLRGPDVVRSVSELDTDHRTRPEHCQTGRTSTRLGYSRR